MKGIPWINAALFVATLTASSAVAWLPFLRVHFAGRGAAEIASEAGLPEDNPLAAGVEHVDYRRIVSASTVSDSLLLDLCEPDRILAFSARSASSPISGYRFAGKAVVDLEDVESVLRLHPDLVVVSSLGDVRRLSRLREAGLPVLDLGELRGMSTLLVDIHKIAIVIGRPERGDRLAQYIVDRMSSIAGDVPMGRRRSAIYLSIYGGRLFGGASGTSYHDVLVAAGLVDAAGAFRDWPQYTSEEVLSLDPEVLVTNAGMADPLCRHAGLSLLRACNVAGGIVEVDDAVLGDPGPAMLDAAQIVRDRVYGPPGANQGSFQR